MTGEDVIRIVRQRTDTVLLAFSAGKDSLGAWLALRPHFRRIIPYYMYLVPGLEFVERGLRMYEDYFSTRIIRVPHPSLYRMLAAMVYQPPERASIIERLGLPDVDYLDIQDGIRADHGLGPECWTADGVRAVDSPRRRIAMSKQGPINEGARKFSPIFDWPKNRLLAAITDAGLKLPVDYRLFGRSFDGIDYRFLMPIKQHFPRDYQRILEWFPLADLDIERRVYAGAH